MTDQEHKLAGKITGYLDQGAADLRPGLAYRLQRARAEALARLSEPERATRLQPAFLTGGTSGTLAGPGQRPFYQQARFWIAIAVLASAVFGTQQWRDYQQAKELAEIDSQILTSDLPIDAYLDRGFQNWLRTSDPN
jgi:hypothetical protein